MDIASEKLETAFTQQLIAAGAVENIKNWLTKSQYAPFAPTVAEHIEQANWKVLNDVFWTALPFTAHGRHGRMYEIGSNTINELTIGETARGLAEAVLEQHQNAKVPSCAIAFGVRHRSRQFARICAEVMAAAGIKVYFCDQPRATPELGHALVRLNCSCGIMISTEQGPANENGIKIYWKNGPMVPPDDQRIMDRVRGVIAVPRKDFESGVAINEIEISTPEVADSFRSATCQFSFSGPRDISILYSPLNGVGSKVAVPVFHADGFRHVEVFPAHADEDGSFPHFPRQMPDFANPQTLKPLIEHARSTGANVLLANDPDCQHVVCAAPLTTDTTGPWEWITSQQIAALLVDYLLEKRAANNSLHSQSTVITTFLTSELVRRIADSYGVNTVSDLTPDFRWLIAEIDGIGSENFVFAADHNYGYLVNPDVRESDGVGAALLLAGLAAECWQTGMSLHQKLFEIFEIHGVFQENRTVLQCSDGTGLGKAGAVMTMFREDPPEKFGDMEVTGIKDFQAQLVREPDYQVFPFSGPRANLVVLELDEPGSYFSVQPLGHEHQLEVCVFTCEKSDSIQSTQIELRERIERVEVDIRKFVDEF